MVPILYCMQIWGFRAGQTSMSMKLNDENATLARVWLPPLVNVWNATLVHISSQQKTPVVLSNQRDHFRYTTWRVKNCHEKVPEILETFVTQPTRTLTNRISCSNAQYTNQIRFVCIEVWLFPRTDDDRARYSIRNSWNQTVIPGDPVWHVRECGLLSFSHETNLWWKNVD
jgi:hypothetical protein